MKILFLFITRHQCIQSLNKAYCNIKLMKELGILEVRKFNYAKKKGIDIVNILVINSGSSSLKYQIIDMENLKVLIEGICERIGIGNSFISYTIDNKKEKKIIDVNTHKEALEEILHIIIKNGVLRDFNDIDAIGHRVVHGGDLFTESVLIDEKVLEKIEKLSSLAPLHNPSNLSGIKTCMTIMPNKPNIAVFDTAFHQTISPKVFMYGLPYEDYQELRVRKYGFHGTSYKYIVKEVEKISKNNKKIIICHLGNGASVCAVKEGKSVDTSMGFTPLQGLMMGTRCGDIDPTSIFYIMKERGLSLEEAEKRLNKESGMLGIFGKSSDSRDIENAILEGDERAILTEEMYAYRVKSYIGSYAAALEGVDAIVFTGGIGENASGIREKICSGFEYLGLEFDKEINNIRKNGIVTLSKDNSKVKVYKIPTNEEYMIALDTYEIVNSKL